MRLEIPFKKLDWKDNTTDIGKKDGIVYFIADFYIDGNQIWTYYATNYSRSCAAPGSCKFKAWFIGGNIGEFDTLEEAKDACQLHFQKKVLEIFFDI
jgi:hypothetical protein